MMDWVHIPGTGRVAVPAPLARVVDETVIERLRQIERGFRAEDDDRFVRGELARAAAARVLWAADEIAQRTGAPTACSPRSPTRRSRPRSGGPPRPRRRDGC
jgi:hypothetical protein